MALQEYSNDCPAGVGVLHHAGTAHHDSCPACRGCHLCVVVGGIENIHPDQLSRDKMALVKQELDLQDEDRMRYSPVTLGARVSLVLTTH